MKFSQFSQFSVAAVLFLFATCVEAGGVIPTVYSRGSLGHLCPVSADTALTAEHVSTARFEDGTTYQPPMIFTQEVDGVKFAGVVEEVDADKTRDLSLVKITKGDKFGRFFPIAQTEPQKGDRVYLVGFDFEKGGVNRLVETKVLYSDGPFLTYDKSGEGGSSGSCVLNEQKEVVGINVGGFASTYKPVGIAVAVWGVWREFLISEYREVFIEK